MAKNLDDVMAALPATRRAKVEQRAQELASLKDLRQALAQLPNRPPVVIDHLAKE